MPKPYTKKNRPGYYANLYVTVRGRTTRQTVKLCNIEEGLEEANKQLRRLLVQAEDGKLGNDPQVAGLINAFLDFSEENNAKRTYGFYRSYLTHFLERNSAYRTVSRFDGSDIDKWLRDDYAEHSPVARHNAARSILRVFNWAKKERLIVTHNLDGYKKPSPESSSGRKKVLSDKKVEKLFERMRAENDEPFLTLATLLRNTLCRPTEIRLVEARWFDREDRCFCFPSDRRTLRRAGIDSQKLVGRTIYLDDESYELTLKAALVHPEGKLFRPARSDQWQTRNLCRRFKRYSRLLGFHIHAYMFRHTGITNAIDRGVHPRQIQEIAGWKSGNMLNVYGHPEQRPDLLRGWLNRLRRDGAPLKDEDDRDHRNGVA